MGLKIYNTLTQSKVEFTPIDPPNVRMYVCGMTVYDLCHIGHARAGIVFDVIYRYLKFRGYRVTYVRNITDIDDKIIKRANELNEDWDVLAHRYTNEFRRDMGKLGLLRPDIEPKATDHIQEMVEMIKELVEKGHAYEIDGSVYFIVRSFAEYGRLSKRNIEELESGARVDVDETKKDPLDFALWKASKPDEPTWDSPWGKGRPGWHIECSAMGRKYLGNTFDIHGGGKDLIFPHHENELAQSCASSGDQPVNFWVHNGFVNVNNEKMSKSLGNTFTIQDLLKKHHPEALRLFFLSHHYRSPIDFADSYLKDAFKNLVRFYDLFAFAESLKAESMQNMTMVDSIRQDFRKEMDDDFNTARAMAVLNSELKRLNKLRSSLEGMKRKSMEFKVGQREFMFDLVTLKEMGAVLGLFGEDPIKFIEVAKQKKLDELHISRAKLEAVLKAREEARIMKDFKKADQVRAELLKAGIVLQDSSKGTTWSIKYD